MTEGAHPLVSIIVPVYNVERYLGECLDSILGQTYDRLEVIVVEDCSTDGSLAALQPHLSDPRVRLIRHEKNAGLSAARNTGIEAAKGDYLMFVDSDDMIGPRLVEAVLDVSLRNSADVVVYGFTAFADGVAMETPAVPDASAIRVFEKTDPDFFSLGYFAWLKFIRADWFKTTSIRFPVGYYYEDHLFHWQLGMSSASIVAFDWNPYGYRQRAGAITERLDRKALDRVDMYSMVLVQLQQTGLSGKLADAWLDRYQELIRTLLLTIQSEVVKDAAKKLGILHRQVRNVPELRSRLGFLRSGCYSILLSENFGIYVIHLLRACKRLLKSLMGIVQ